jgi:DNA primase
VAYSIPKAFINDLLTQCDIVTLINSLLPLRKQGTNYVALCPFHEEDTPSFTVSDIKQMYHCFGCGVGGNSVSFIMAYEKLDFIRAVEWLANYLHIAIPRQRAHYSAFKNNFQDLYQSLEEAATFYQSQLRQTPLALDYLGRRGFSDKSIQDFKLGFAPSNWDSLFKFLTQQSQHTPSTLKTAGLILQKGAAHYYDRFRARIIFPIRDHQGRCIGLGGRVLNADEQPKYLNSPETPIFQKSRILYGFYESSSAEKNTQRIWVVEGYFDVMMFYQFGIAPVIGTLGTAISRSHLQQLFRLTEEVIFCFDGDLAGEKAAIRALTLSLSSIQDNWNIRFLLLPSGEDPDSWIRQQPADTAQERLISQTVSLEDFLLQHLQKDINVNTLEGQRQLLQKAIPLLKKMPLCIRREQLFQRLARLVNIETNKLQQLLFQDYRLKYPTLPIKQSSAYTVVDRALGLLLQYPQLLHPCLSQSFNRHFQADYPLLNQLIDIIRDSKDTHTALLLEQFSHQPPNLLTDLTALAQYNWLIPQDGVLAEFQDIIKYLNHASRHRAIQALIQKTRQAALTVDESAQLDQLLRAKAEETL